jgi:hypothetical protein
MGIVSKLFWSQSHEMFVGCEQQERKKIHTVRPAGLKSRRSFGYTIITKNSCFWLCCCSLHNAQCIIGDQFSWLDLALKSISSLKAFENSPEGYLDLQQKAKKHDFAIFHLLDYFLLWKKSKTEMWCWETKRHNCCVSLRTAVPNDFSVVTQLVETMELMHVEDPKATYKR